MIEQVRFDAEDRVDAKKHQVWGEADEKRRHGLDIALAQLGFPCLLRHKKENNAAHIA